MTAETPKLPPITPELIKTEAEKRTQLSDWGDTHYEEALQRLVTSFNEESGTGHEGKLDFLDKTITAGITRLSVVAALTQNPGILQTAIEKPLFICGMPRTGTTLLQRLISADPNLRALLFWESQIPSPPPRPETHARDPRIAQLEEIMGKFDARASELNSIHRVAVTEPDECYPLFVRDYASGFFYTCFNTPSYLAWLKQRDMTPSYRFYKQQLQLLSYHFPAQRWVLKEPAHLNYLDVVVEVFPDARFLITHRDPIQVVASACSMGAYLRKISGNIEPDEVQYGPIGLAIMADNWRRAIELREKLDPSHFVDVSYKTLVADPLTTVSSAYAAFGDDLSQEAQTAMSTYLSQNRQGKHGRHQYSLERFGLSEDMVRDAFGFYYEKYGHLLG